MERKGLLPSMEIMEFEKNQHKKTHQCIQYTKILHYLIDKINQLNIDRVQNNNRFLASIARMEGLNSVRLLRPTLKFPLEKYICELNANLMNKGQFIIASAMFIDALDVRLLECHNRMKLIEVYKAQRTSRWASQLIVFKNSAMIYKDHECHDVTSTHMDEWVQRNNTIFLAVDKLSAELIRDIKKLYSSVCEHEYKIEQYEAFLTRESTFYGFQPRFFCPCFGKN